MLIRMKTCCLLRAISLRVPSPQKASQVMSPLFVSVQMLINIAHLAVQSVIATWVGCMTVATYYCNTLHHKWLHS